MSISNSGNKAEDRFRSLTGAVKASASKQGDFLLEGHNGEIKDASGGTANQVRALKYIPLVVLSKGTWFVVPPNKVVELLEHRRGQHGGNPFQNATISASSLKGFEVDEGNLKQAVLDAVAMGEAHPRLKAEMQAIIEETEALATAQKARVSCILAEEK